MSEFRPLIYAVAALLAATLCVAVAIMVSRGAATGVLPLIAVVIGVIVLTPLVTATRKWEHLPKKAIIVGVLLSPILHLFSDHTTKHYGSTCINCLETSRGIENTIFGISFYRSESVPGG